jgi:hypothetical protein
VYKHPVYQTETSSVITDVFEDSYMFVFVWYVNGTFMGWNQNGNMIYPGSNISGDLNKIMLSKKKLYTIGIIPKEIIHT